ncbi:trans-aconitate 2-methyltransferase [Streptomyces sp. NPDC096205]|uniref:trans-aconitate 2-methyltransferase n=1 Tax=Streptomyces sp. NPDC096205 TaxID=3366081 RepID=UPI00380590A7
MTTPTWDPAQYLRHADHRARPFADLLARVPDLPSARPRIADLGCGPGNVTALLADRWPTAHITGHDNSVEMLDRAHVEHAGDNIDFAYADVRTWTPSEPYDLIISNATLQWVPGHTERFPAWITGLRPGGTLAFQVPGNFDAPSHRLMRTLAARHGVGDVLRHEDAVLTPAAYLSRLADLGCTVDAWETTYVHVLQGEDPVLDWVKGTGLRPILTALADDPEARDAFVRDYRQALREAYPSTPHGTAFAFRRVFVVARKEA